MAAVEAVLVGGGNRGCFTVGRFARARPDRLRIVAPAEPEDERRAAVAAEHGFVIELEGGATATFTLNGLARHEKRTIRASGTEGELRGVLPDGGVELAEIRAAARVAAGLPA